MLSRLLNSALGSGNNMEIDESRIVARGTWKYDGTVECQIIILAEDVWPAFFDPDDDPNVDDEVMPCVSVWYENPGGGHTFDAGGGYYHNVEEAKAEIERVINSRVTWKA
jgi:hypothetical protein